MGIKSDFEKAFEEKFKVPHAESITKVFTNWAFIQGMREASEIAEKNPHPCNTHAQFEISNEILSAIKEFES